MSEKGLSHYIIESQQGIVGVDGPVVTADDRKKLAEFYPATRFEVSAWQGQYDKEKEKETCKDLPEGGVNDFGRVFEAGEDDARMDVVKIGAISPVVFNIVHNELDIRRQPDRLDW